MFPSNQELVDGTVPSNKELMDGTVMSNILIQKDKRLFKADVSYLWSYCLRKAMGKKFNLYHG